jgi:signal transduction histidine kinase
VRTLVHDLRSTLTGTRGFLELLATFGPGTPGYDPVWIQEALGSADRALALLAAASETVRSARETGAEPARAELRGLVAARLAARPAASPHRIELAAGGDELPVAASAAFLDRLLEAFLAPASGPDPATWQLVVGADPALPGNARVELVLRAGAPPTPSETNRLLCRFGAILLAGALLENPQPAAWSRTLVLPRPSD